jgi:uncharacterized glyoxalase superfamily protein PhnB
MIMPTVAVKDIEASIAFYVNKLGFTHGVTMPGPDGKPNFAIVDLGEAVHIGLQLDTATEHRGNGVVFMVYVADSTDIDAYYAQVQKNGAVIEEPIKTEYWGDRVFSLRDPDGYFLSLCKTVKAMSVDEIREARPDQK